MPYSSSPRRKVRNFPPRHRVSIASVSVFTLELLEDGFIRKRNQLGWVDVVAIPIRFSICLARRFAVRRCGLAFWRRSFRRRGRQRERCDHLEHFRCLSGEILRSGGGLVRDGGRLLRGLIHTLDGVVELVDTLTLLF